MGGCIGRRGSKKPEYRIKKVQRRICEGCRKELTDEDMFYVVANVGVLCKPCHEKFDGSFPKEGEDIIPVECMKCRKVVMFDQSYRNKCPNCGAKIVL